MIATTRKVPRYAQRYCECGFTLTWSPPGEKGPRHRSWNRPENAITDPQAAMRFWSEHPDYGIGALLEPSGKVSLDVDDVPHTRTILAAFGIDLDAIDAPRIVGNPAKFRLMFEAPAVQLHHRTAAWPQADDPRKAFAIFELRAGLVSDALPPTIHPGTRQPYRWSIPPRNGFPPLPDRMLELWRDWPATAKRIRTLCPWATPLPERRPITVVPRDRDRPSVIQAFNAAHDPASILEAHGYMRRGNRFASPETRHAAGIVILDSGKVFCHHAGDPLGGGVARDAFDLYVLFEHQGDFRSAVRAAARLLDIAPERCG